MDRHPASDPAVAAAITRASSKQTYFTIRFLADKRRVEDAYRAYAYFRWVDDWLDLESRPTAERLDFVARQQALMLEGYQGRVIVDLTPEERLLVDLIQSDTEPHSGLQAYIRNMMAVMAFDANRRGKLVSRSELHDYTRWLAVSVTEALHHFIGHDGASPQGELRYMAVIGAHIAHMLRDALEDAEAGYYNIPSEVVSAHNISPWDVQSTAYREWVKDRVHVARMCLRIGRDSIAQVENLRCRIAGHAYIRRFEVVLDYIEREGWLLRAQYPESKGRRRGVEMIGRALGRALYTRRPANISSAAPVR